MLVVGQSTEANEIAAILTEYVPQPILMFLETAKQQIMHVAGTYTKASPELRRLGVSFEAWPAAPSGLFVVAEGTAYVRTISPMTVVHEVGHALDLALGNEAGKDHYRSVGDGTIRASFSTEDFVTPYAASSIDEFFAESFRAWCQANDPASLWTDVSRERLAKRTPTMLVFFDDLLVRLNDQMRIAR